MREHNDITSQVFADGDYLREAIARRQRWRVMTLVTERELRVNVAKTIDLGAGNDRNDVCWSLADANTILGGPGDDTIFLGYLSFVRCCIV